MTSGAVPPRSSTKPLAALVTLRMLIGWHFLYEGLVKLLNPNWTAAEFLAQSQGPFSGIFHWFLGDPARLAAVDSLNRWGLVLIGAGLIAGLLTRYATMAAMLLLALYYLCSPPLPFYTYSMPTEGSYLIVNKVLIELAALWVLLAFPTGDSVGLDRMFARGRRAGDVQ